MKACFIQADLDGGSRLEEAGVVGYWKHFGLGRHCNYGGLKVLKLDCSSRCFHRGGFEILNGFCFGTRGKESIQEGSVKVKHEVHKMILVCMHAFKFVYIYIYILYDHLKRTKII